MYLGGIFKQISCGAQARALSAEIQSKGALVEVSAAAGPGGALAGGAEKGTRRDGGRVSLRVMLRAAASVLLSIGCEWWAVQASPAMSRHGSVRD